MELKLPSLPFAILGLNCSNRTFMELKYEYVCTLEEKKQGSNRTFMELKW